MQKSNAVELWLPIPGYTGYYEASTTGLVRSIDRDIVRSNGSPMRLRGRVRQLCELDGWMSVTLSIAGVLQSYRVHHLVLRTFTGPCPPGMEGCHNDGNFRHNWIDNLRWDTSSSNHFDKVRHGTDHNRNKDGCPREHLLVMPNLVRVKWERDGWRECLACDRAKANENYAKRCGRLFNFRAAADRHYARIMSLGVRRGVGQNRASRRPQRTQT